MYLKELILFMKLDSRGFFELSIYLSLRIFSLDMLYQSKNRKHDCIGIMNNILYILQEIKTGKPFCCLCHECGHATADDLRTVLTGASTTVYEVDFDGYPIHGQQLTGKPFCCL
uniref:Uncharacterized protein n=1 Tax=Cacopsylla melanoneura TaxID=428564 RepID=A0A8D8W8G0_9HEMI